MPNVTVTLKTGEIILFEDRGRPGGSYSNSVKYEGAFAVVEDVWGKTTAFPAQDIQKIEKDAPRRSW